MWNQLMGREEFKPILAAPPAASPPATPVAPVPAKPATIKPDAAKGEVARPGNPMAWGDAGRMGVGREFDAIYFNGQSAELDAVAKSRLDGYAEWLRTHPQVWLTLAGSTDLTNAIEQDYNLGMVRALTVAEYLAFHGLDPRRIYSITYGKDRPAAEGTKPEANALNNRVEVYGFVAPLGQDAPAPATALKDAAPDPETLPPPPEGRELTR